MSTPTSTERELDAWIADHIFGLKVNGDRVLVQRRKLTSLKTVETCEISYDVDRYTADPAAAMQVLERCAVGSVLTHLTKLGDEWIIYRGDDTAIKDRIVAETLPLAIARFARKIFEK